MSTMTFPIIGVNLWLFVKVSIFFCLKIYHLSLNFDTRYSSFVHCNYRDFSYGYIQLLVYVLYRKGEMMKHKKKNVQLITL